MVEIDIESMALDDPLTQTNRYLSDTFGLLDHHAIVTGAAGGIGAAISLALSRAGASVTLVDIDTPRLETVAKQISSEGGTVVAVTLDITNLAEQRKWFKQASKSDILVNCAGVNRMKIAIEMTPEDYDRIISLNTKAAYFISQSFAQSLIAKNGSGSIINISSQMGLVGGPKRSLYCASKHALEGFTKAMALELGQHNIRVNSVCPTFVETELSKDFLDDPTFRTDVDQRICLGRLGAVEDVANAAVFLASKASGLITGSNIKVDGGWTAA